MLARISLIWLIVALPLCEASAQDEPARLPGQGHIKKDVPFAKGLGRLIPGGGLLLSFDSNQDGQITQIEIDEGINEAFLKADTNEDGRITPLEQIKWTQSLPTRDESLANPARFDPNLDRRVQHREFTEIVQAFAALHMDTTTQTIPVIALKYQGRVGRGGPSSDPDSNDIDVRDRTDRGPDQRSGRTPG